MAVTVTDLTTLDTKTVQSNQSLLTQLVQEAFPSVDVKRGPIHDLVLYLEAVLHTADNQNIELLRQSSSLQQVIANPSVADSTTVANIAGNFNLPINNGSVATGTVSIVVNTLTPVTIANGAVFTYNNLTFTSNDSYNAKTASNLVILPTDRLLTLTSNGNYAFSINVTATATGSAYNLSANTQLTPVIAPAYFVSAYASPGFSGGSDADTPTTLMAKLSNGLAVKAMSNRITDIAMLRNNPTFANIIDMSEVGFGDAEQRRYHSIFPVAFGGRVDMYVKTQPLYQVNVLTKTAVLDSVAGTNGTWRFSISSEDAYGYYEIVKIIRAIDTVNSSGFQPSTDTRTYNSSATTPFPDITSTVEAVYTRYQAGSITFVDTLTDASGLTVGVSTGNYLVYIRYMPLVKEIQDFVLTRTVRHETADVLVKAPVPCFTSVSFNINKPHSKADPNLSVIKTAVANAINNMGFVGQLVASTIYQAVQVNIDATMTVSNINMIGRIRTPTGATTILHDSSVLTVPNDPTNMVSSKTVAFYLDPNDISITINAI